MEFHIAIKNILKYQGQDFLLDSKMVNALVDFQAYEFHPAMKNIFRTLHADGYIGKIVKLGRWTASCDQLIFEVERDYAFPRDLIEYIFKSVAYGIGALSSVTAPVRDSLSQNKPQQAPQPQAPTKPWKRLSDFEKSEVLESFIEIDAISFAKFGFKVTSYSISDVYEEGSVHQFNINYELNRIDKSPMQYANFAFAIYDKNGKMRKAEDYFYEIKKISNFITDSYYLCISIPLDKIGRIYIYMKS